jgi:hypothetical protein
MFVHSPMRRRRSPPATGSRAGLRMTIRLARIHADAPSRVVADIPRNQPHGLPLTGHLVRQGHCRKQLDDKSFSDRAQERMK